jgi:metal-dependent hydrolase (beta-lactamase superfamily II)
MNGATSGRAEISCFRGGAVLCRFRPFFGDHCPCRCRISVLLFDAGPEAYAIARSAERLRIAFGDVGAIVLSNSHWDHAGGLLDAVRKVASANGGSRLPCQPGMFLTVRFIFPTDTA